MASSSIITSAFLPSERLQNELPSATATIVAVVPTQRLLHLPGSTKSHIVLHGLHFVEKMDMVVGEERRSSWRLWTWLRRRWEGSRGGSEQGQ